MIVLSPLPANLPAIVVVPPCGHPGEILPEWIRPDGRFDGRLCCTAPGCRQIFEDVRVKL